jgi:quercetin dioxygenase-like cupin family protein
VDGYVFGPEEGEAYNWRGAQIVIKAAAEQTLGQLAVMESVYPPGLVVPTHFHQGEDEMFYLLDGQLQMLCDDQQWTTSPGSFVFVPRDHPHSFTVLSESPARALVVVGPPQLDQQIKATGHPLPAPTAISE